MHVVVRVVMVVAVVVGGLVPGSRAEAQEERSAVVAPVPGSGAARPRLLYAPGSEGSLRDRLGREPYRTVFLTMHAQAAGWQGATLGDLSVNAQRNLLRVAKIRAFQYALDRTVVGGEVVPFASAGVRAAAGDQARDVLLQILDRSRLAVPPPIGGWDRDISSSEEIVMAAQTYDVLLGAGYPLDEEDDAEIVRRLAAATRELRLNFVSPETAGGYAALHQNNHRTKTGTALAVAAVALADQVPDARGWFDTGADYVDDTLRHVLLTGDGAYAEGPFYFRYTTQNLIPYLGAWERFLGTGSWTTADGLVIGSLVGHPLLARTQRWMLDTSVPDGTMAPIDDGNPGRSAFYGAMPHAMGSTAEGYWQWARTPQPYDIDGNITLGPDSIVTYDDGVTPTAPSWEPSQVYVEGGTATLRSGWGPDAAMAVVLGEHDTASEFGRDREGVGRWPQSHEHPDPASFMLYAHGERLALDPGYLSFTNHGRVNRPEHHNVLLVDGEGPPDYLAASVEWGKDPAARPPAEGQSTLTGTVVSDVADGVSVATAYRGAQLTRRVLLGGDRYLVVADVVDAPAADQLTWMLHGNGGGTSGGTYQPTAAGGRWTIGGARLDSGIAVSTGAPARTETEAVHEIPYTQERTHTALAATAPAAATTAAVQVLYPTPSGSAAPTVERTTPGGHVGLTVTDAALGRIVTVVQRSGGDADLSDADLSDADLSGAGIDTDGDLLVVERTTGGDLVSVWAEGATRIAGSGADLLRSARAGTLGARIDAGTVHVVADTGTPTVEVGALGGAPTDVDGACGVDGAGAAGPGTTTVTLNRTRTATLRASAGPSRPAADAGPPVRVAPGTDVVLDGTASCDADDDGDGLSPRWELVSAPAGSAWTLEGSDGWHPRLRADRVGPYRVRLVVTDPTGRTSTESEVVVKAGARCADGIDDDLDGLIDTDDADCDGPEPPPPGDPFVVALYRDLLGREPDAAGLAWWTSRLEAGASRSSIVARIRRTPEMTRRMVRIAYDSYLGRAASATDRDYWARYLAAGRRFDDLVVQLLASAEAQRRAGPSVEDLVARSVRLVLGRQATPAEVTSGAATVRRAGKAAHLRGLLRTDTAARLRVTAIYQALLGRAPDTAGLAFWAARLRAGGDVIDVLASVAASEEYARRAPNRRGPGDVLRRALVG